MDPQTPQPIMPAPSPQPAAPTPMGGGKKGKGLLIGIIVAAVLVVAGGAWAVYALFFSSTPDSLLKDALKNLSQTNTVAADFELGTQGANITGTLAATTDSSNKNGELILSFGEGDKSIELRMLTIDGGLFFKTANVELAAPLVALYTGLESFGSQGFVDALKNINGIWFEATKEQLDEMAEGTDGPTGATLAAEDIKKVLQIYDQHAFIKPDKIYPDEAVNGKQSAHLSLVVDKQKAVAFLEAVKAANLESIKPTDEDIAKIKESSELENSTAEVWIARDTKTFTKFKFAGTADGQDMSIILTTIQPPAFDALERPVETRPISDLMGILFGYPTTTDGLESELMY